MGALYGYFHSDQADSVSIHDKMSKPALYWGKEKHFLYNDNSIVLGYLHRYNTPESVFESQPYKTIAGEIIFFNGRIDNRKELFSSLNLSEINDQPMGRQVFSDGKLVTACREKYKNDIVHHIEGDWVIVVWNPANHKLQIFRDHHGYSALYYYCTDRFFAFATSIKSLLALDQIPKKPDIKRVVQTVTSWQGEGLNSAYEGILRLPPAHVLETDEKFVVQTSRYWFPENTQPLHLTNEKDYYQQFFEEYSRAVDVRLRSYKPVGSQLSGGLDSGTVVTLAAGLLKKNNTRLPAFTSVPVYNIKGLTSKTRFGDESYLAKLTADFTGNTDWIPVDAAEVDPFKAIAEGVEIHDEPFHAGANTFWISEIKRLAMEMNLGTMLTGQGGNATVSWPTPGFLQIMSRKKDLIRYKHFVSYYGWRHVILPLITPHSVKSFIQHKKKGQLPFLEYSAIKKEYAVKNRIQEQMQEEDHDPYFSKTNSPLSTRLKIIKPGSSIVGFLHSQAAAWHDLEMRDPTFDKRLVEFCLSVPDHIYVSGGKDRLLIRKAFDGLMPDEVLWNTNRGRQAADIGHRVVKFQESGRLMLDEISKSSLCKEMLDIEKMKSIFESLSKEVNSENNSKAGTILLRGITAGLFLLRFDR